jgi:hypothetical protein
MSFEANQIQVKTHIYDLVSTMSYDETILDKEGALWIEPLTARSVPKLTKLEAMVLNEYHLFMNLFRQPLVQEFPPHHSFDYQIRIKEGKEIPFAPIYHLSEKELGAL